MKFLPTDVRRAVLSGVLLVLPLTASSAFAQSGTPSGTQTGSTASGTTKAQATPSGAASTAPSNRSISSLTPGAPTPPAHPITMEQTRELLDLMNYKKIEESNWSQMIAMNKQAAPFIPADVWTDVQTNISGIDYPIPDAAHLREVSLAGRRSEGAGVLPDAGREARAAVDAADAGRERCGRTAEGTASGSRRDREASSGD